MFRRPIQRRQTLEEDARIGFWDIRRSKNQSNTGYILLLALAVGINQAGIRLISPCVDEVKEGNKAVEIAKWV